MPSANPPQQPVDEAAALAVFQAFKLDGFFPEFNAELCGKVFPRSGILQFRQGEILMEQGEAARDLFLVLAGEASVHRKEPSGVEIGRVRPGDVLGEIALLFDVERTATVTAATPLIAYRLVFADVGYTLQHNPGLAKHLKALAQQRKAR